MSTVDPTIAKRERENKKKKAASPGQLLGVLVLTLLFASATGWVVTPMIVDGVSPSPFIQLPQVLLLIALVVGTSWGVSWWTGNVEHRPGWLGWGGISGLALIAGALGSGVSAPPPDWLHPLALNAITIGIGAAGMGLIALSIVVRSIRRRKANFEEYLVQHTSPVTAVVTDQGYRDSSDWRGDGGHADFLGTSVVYSFTDHEGTQRWVTRHELLPRENPLAEGDEFDLWFDRARPGNTGRMVIRPRTAKWPAYPPEADQLPVPNPIVSETYE